MKQIEPRDHHIFYEREERRDKADMECAIERQNRFRELWEKAANPATPEDQIEEANRELQRLQAEYWKAKEKLYWESLGL